jgi:hypothetical protein
VADEAEWFVAFVERLLQQVFGSPEVNQDEDGDYPFGDGGATAYVGMASDIGDMFAVVRGGDSVLAEPQAS